MTIDKRTNRELPVFTQALKPAATGTVRDSLFISLLKSAALLRRSVIRAPLSPAALGAFRPFLLPPRSSRPVGRRILLTRQGAPGDP